MSDTNVTIAKLYGDASTSNTPTTEPKAQPTAERSEDDLADALYGSRDSLASTYGPSLTDSMNVLRDQTGMSAPQFTTAIAEAAEVFRDARITPEHAARLHWQLTHHLSTRPDDATIEAWAAETASRAARALWRRGGRPTPRDGA